LHAGWGLERNNLLNVIISTGWEFAVFVVLMIPKFRVPGNKRAAGNRMRNRAKNKNQGQKLRE